MRQPVELLPWALLSVAALVLSASAADALRRGTPLALEPTVEVGGADKVPARFTLGAEAFALDSAELPRELQRPLDAVADALRASGASAVRIEVHTDASGPIEARRSLTQRRADAIKLLPGRARCRCGHAAQRGHGVQRAAAPEWTRTPAATGAWRSCACSGPFRPAATIGAR